MVNAFGDIVSCVIGYLLATRLPVRWSAALVVVVEATLLFLHRDSLVLNIVMLICPIDAIKAWPMNR